MRILTLGAGVWGSAMSYYLASNKHSVSVWSYSNNHIDELNRGHHKNINRTILSNNLNFFNSEISEIDFNSYDYVLLAIPVQKTRGIISKIKHKILKTPFVILSKGLEENSSKRISEILEEYEIKNICTLYGPTHSDGILNRDLSFMVVSSKNRELNDSICKIFSSKDLIIEKSNNIFASEMFAAAKNSGAIIYGIISGLELGINTKAVIFSKIFDEISHLIGENFKNNLSFLGDLFATSLKGRNRDYGYNLVKNPNNNIGMVVEGISNTKAIVKLAKKEGLELPMFNLLYSIIKGNSKPEEILKLFYKEIQ
jgi:glycerol-3-phosphate dehydrogenase (NAD(P)+)